MAQHFSWSEKYWCATLLHREKNKYRQINWVWAWGSVTSYTLLVSCVLCCLLHLQVDITLGRQVKKTTHQISLQSVKSYWIVIHILLLNLSENPLFDEICSLVWIFFLTSMRHCQCGRITLKQQSLSGKGLLTLKWNPGRGGHGPWHAMCSRKWKSTWYTVGG